MPTTWGMPAHRDYVPTEDALQVARLEAAGARGPGGVSPPVARDLGRAHGGGGEGDAAL
nr:hypothetical protein [Nocardia wallacei]